MTQKRKYWSIKSDSEYIKKKKKKWKSEMKIKSCNLPGYSFSLPWFQWNQVIACIISMKFLITWIQDPVTWHCI